MKFKKGDLVDIGGYVNEGEPRVTTPYILAEDPIGKFARIYQEAHAGWMSPPVITVYMGRWFTPAKAVLNA